MVRVEVHIAGSEWVDVFEGPEDAGLVQALAWLAGGRVVRLWHL